ncbi:TylF/MycF/NovP-related O-methyltransferase [Actinoplanes sp. NEAU-A12]|uniref:TylF/MycF/NovP-related O-methyltransferase n=1 Tax=Actinoplanes sandaracinus TaxID=3045177 RepID=A0ABT6WIJ0_9ACTN|nr:TylF/MycF/NovP-related O-methyltransferase [Actinoplanes sandaracinus]MDI6099552.1 TylF/MycF/NovP-related O-methyltransferase [Actinoplanes sandaracinus]
MRKSVNRALRGLTGYELRKAKKPVAKPVTRPEPAPAAEPAAARQPEITFPVDYDDAARDTIRTVRPWTMTSPEKLNALVYAVRYVVRHRIPGDIVECGVWRGGSMLAVAKTLAEAGDTARHLHLYDTFEGMSEPTEHDKRHDGRSAADMLAASDKSAGVWAYASFEDVRATMRESAYPADRIHYYRGKVEDTIPAGAPEQISILRLDTDWYESTRHELVHLWPRLVPGGVLLLDDYGWWDGARRAVDEWLAETNPRVLLLRMDEGRIAVKQE